MLKELVKLGLNHWGDSLDFEKLPEDFRLVNETLFVENYGAAHGIFGNLYLMMKAYELNKTYLTEKEPDFTKKLLICFKRSMAWAITK